MKDQVFEEIDVERESYFKELENKRDSMELIRCQSGKWFSFSQHDLEIFIADTKAVIGKFLLAEEKVGLFLDFDNANFLSLVLYAACINCGSTVIRCGISDLTRQLPIQNGIFLDWLICTDIVYKYIKDIIPHNNYILVYKNINANIDYSNEISVAEFYDMPNFYIRTKSELVIPGYDMHKEKKQIVIEKRNNIENNQLPDSIIECIPQINATNVIRDESVVDFICLTVNWLVKYQLCGEVMENDNSIIINSIGMIELLVKVEEEFGIEFPLESITREIVENSRLLSRLVFNIMWEKKYE